MVLNMGHCIMGLLAWDSVEDGCVSVGAHIIWRIWFWFTDPETFVTPAQLISGRRLRSSPETWQWPSSTHFLWTSLTSASCRSVSMSDICCPMTGETAVTQQRSEAGRWGSRGRLDPSVSTLLDRVVQEGGGWFLNDIKSSVNVSVWSSSVPLDSEERHKRTNRLAAGWDVSLSVCSHCCCSACQSAVRSHQAGSCYSDPDEEMEAEGGRNVQRLQAESRGCVREEDGEHLLGVQQELRGIVPVLETILDRRRLTSC